MAQAAFDWRDPLRLGDQLDEDERLIRDSTRDFAAKELAPVIVDWNRHEKFDPELKLSHIHI